jgi:hypothetical protein
MPRLAIPLFVGCITLAASAGCISSAQKETVDKWSAAYFQVERERGGKLEFGVRSASHIVPASFVLAKIGKPDYVVLGSQLERIIPNGTIRDAIIKRSSLDFAGLTMMSQPPQSATDSIMGSSLWFYDEAARYRWPSQPASFWGMGTGYQVLWFVVDSKNEIIAQGARGYAEPIAPFYHMKN